MKQKIIVIMGPTGVGKTNLALEIAKQYNAAIISADSMQVYKNLNIGTAKESEEELKSVPHYLIDILEPDVLWNAGDFKKSAQQVLTMLQKDNVLPIIAGGTGMYVKALIYPYSFSNAVADNKIREKYEELAKQHGNLYVHNILKNIDPISASKIHQNQLKRVIRAIEIFETTGKPKSQQGGEEELESEYEPLIIILNREREELYERINLRVDKMLQQGLVEEARIIYQNNGFNKLSAEAIGYKQLIAYFNGETSLEFAIEKIKQLSRNYAKRQITFFKGFQNAIWFHPEKDKEKIFNTIDQFVNKK